jgi:hypothetical protein
MLGSKLYSDGGGEGAVGARGREHQAAGWRLAGRSGVVEVIISCLGSTAREARKEVFVSEEMRVRMPESEAMAS